MLVALSQELELRREEMPDKEVQTIYFGGGTPSLLEVEEINNLIKSVYDNYTVSSDPEITLEANPDDLSKAQIIKLANSPVNRLSIGVQSFFDEDLKLMNRAHNKSQAAECVENAMQHFNNISIDLIYGIPNMSNKRWLENIGKALSLKVPHISSYALTVEPKTALKKFIEKGIIEDVNDELAHEQFHILVNQLEKEGFTHYEISNFGKPGYFSKNNTAYWQGKHFLGIGPSAHSYDGSSRAWNVRNNSRYINAISAFSLPQKKEELSLKDQYNEYVMTGLRTMWGVSLAHIKTRFGSDYASHLLNSAQKFINEELLSLEEETLRATKKGKFLIDGIAADLFLLNLN